MVQLDNLKFSTNFGVLYELKNIKGHKTLNETYKSLETDDVENILCVMRISYNKANKVNLSEDEFVSFLDERNIGFMKLAEYYGKLVEGIMFNGLSEEEIASRKNAIADLMKKQ